MRKILSQMCNSSLYYAYKGQIHLFNLIKYVLLNYIHLFLHEWQIVAKITLKCKYLKMVQFAAIFIQKVHTLVNDSLEILKYILVTQSLTLDGKGTLHSLFWHSKAL